MPYRFSNFEDAFSYLESLGFKVSNIALNWITPLKSSSKKATLFYSGKDVGYIETPSDILPDEDWAVNIPFEKRSLIPQGVLNAIFGNTGGNEGWENRQFYIETTHFTRMQFGPQLEYTIEAAGPESTIRLKSISSVLDLYKTTTNDVDTVNIGIKYAELAQQLRYEFADIIENVALNRPRPQDFDLTGAQPGYVISLDSNYTCGWLPLSAVLGDSVVPEAVNAQKLNNLPASEYVHTGNLTQKLTDIVSNNIEQGITVIADDGKLHFQVNSFNIKLTGAVTGQAVVNNLSDVSIFTTYSASSHTHDDRYVVLEGNSVVTGTIGASHFNSLIGTINGFRFLSNLENEASVKASLYTYWNISDVCYTLAIEVSDEQHDSVIFKAGREYTLTALNASNVFEQYNIEYYNKIETGTYSTIHINEYVAEHDNLTTTISNNCELDITNNYTLNVLGTLSYNIDTGVFNFSNLDMMINNALNIYSTDISINTTTFNIDSSSDVFIRSLANTHLTTSDIFYIEAQTIQTNAEYMSILLIDNSTFSLTSNVINLLTGDSALNIQIDDNIALLSNDVIAIEIPNGYTLIANASTETITTTKNINASAFNVSTNTFLINATAMTFMGGDATFTNDVYINGSLHLSGSSSSSGSLSTADRFLLLNSGETENGVSAPGMAGLEIDRGTALNVKLYWDENTKSFKILNHLNETYSVLTEATLLTLSNNYVSITGATMTGTLVLHADPINTMEAVTKQYVDYQISNHDSEHDDSFLQLMGGTLTGPLTLANDPIDELDAVTKQYVDDYFINVNGGTMTGMLTLASDPVDDMDAVTKSYADNLGDSTVTSAFNSRRKYYRIGNGTDTEIVLIHNLNNPFVFVKVIDITTSLEVDCGIKHSNNAITLYFATAPATDSLDVYMIVF